MQADHAGPKAVKHPFCDERKDLVRELALGRMRGNWQVLEVTSLHSSSQYNLKIKPSICKGFNAQLKRH